MPAHVIALTPARILELVDELHDAIEQARNATAGALELSKRIERAAGEATLAGDASLLLGHVASQARMCTDSINGDADALENFSAALEDVRVTRDLAELASRSASG